MHLMRRGPRHESAEFTHSGFVDEIGAFANHTVAVEPASVESVPRKGCCMRRAYQRVVIPLELAGEDSAYEFMDDDVRDSRVEG